MISMEAWTTIRYLKAQGLGTRSIAKEVGVSRNTVRKALEREGRHHYSRPARSNPRLEPFKEAITLMLVEQRFIGTRIFSELRQRGIRAPLQPCIVI